MFQKMCICNLFYVYGVTDGIMRNEKIATQMSAYLIRASILNI